MLGPLQTIDLDGRADPTGSPDWNTSGRIVGGQVGREWTYRQSGRRRALLICALIVTLGSAKENRKRSGMREPGWLENEATRPIQKLREQVKLRPASRYVLVAGLPRNSSFIGLQLWSSISPDSAYSECLGKLRLAMIA